MPQYRGRKVTLYINGKPVPATVYDWSPMASAMAAATASFACLGAALWAHRLAEVFGSTDPTLESLLTPEEP
jgi:hypothetical protein